MKRASIMLGAVVTLVLAACGGEGGGADGGGDTDDGSRRAAAPAEAEHPEFKACELLTLDDAKSLIGPQASRAEEGSSIDMRTSDVALTMCAYTDENVDHYVSLLVRAGLTDAGAKSNENGCSVERSASAQDAPQFGKGATFDPEMNQVCTVTNGIYVILSNSKRSDRPPSDAEELAEITKVADIVLPRLA